MPEAGSAECSTTTEKSHMKYVNWITISTSIVSLILIGLLTAGWHKASAEYSEFQLMKTEVQVGKEHRMQMQQAVKVWDQIAIDVAGIKKNMMTVTGRATVRNFGEIACLRINSMSRAALYAKLEKARVTNMSSAELPSVVVKIDGVFQHADENYLAIMSKHAASLIDADAGTSVNIRIEPVEGK